MRREKMGLWESVVIAVFVVTAVALHVAGSDDGVFFMLLAILAAIMLDTK